MFYSLMFCLFHCPTDFLQSIEETGFYRRQGESKNLGNIGKAVVTIDSESDYFCLFFRDFREQLGNSLIVCLVVFRRKVSHIKANI